MADNDPPFPSSPRSRTVAPRRTWLSPVWILPILAAAAGVWVAVTRILAEGPTITIVFRTAEGLEAGKTKIHYNGIDIGTLASIRLSDDHQSAIATAQMAPKTESLLLADTKFWIVSPRISGANVTGLATLISGAYIGMEIGKARESRRDFVALETPPVVSGEAPGRFFLLKSPTLGSLDTGTPIFFRRLSVGEVVSYELDPGGEALTVKVFVNAPYDQYVNPNTRFWHASGIDVSLSASGLSVQTQSVLSVLVGGIAFETAATEPVLPPAEPNAVFTLFSDRGAAFKPSARDPQTYEVVFQDSVRGLAPGAPVEFRGIPIGEVVEVGAEVDARTFQFSAPVKILLDATRLGVKIRDLAPGADLASARRQLVESFVAHGVRAQLRSGNLLTGALFVAFDFFPDAPAATVDWSQTPVRLPTIPGQIQELEARVASIIKKIDELPLQAIGQDLRKAIVELDRTLASARGTLDSADAMIQPDSVLGAELGTTLGEVNRAARGLRVLVDYLERHPESLLRGKPDEGK
jgi:paraquat-inducible protein B